MALINSQASVLADSDGQNDSVENISAVFNPEAANNDNIPPARRRRWALFFRRGQDKRNDGRLNESNKSKPPSITCTCKGAVKASCLITCSSIIELIGNLLALVYGIAFIQSACNFYGSDKNAEKKEKEYDEQLERILFLEKNRVGFVGLLATCLVGLIVAFLMPIGTIYRSWKSLRAAMSLLFSMCLAHIILASIYLSDNELMATLAAVPFRIYEILLIYNHIKMYKKKKLEEAMRTMEGDRGVDSTIDSQNPLGTASFNSTEQENIMSSRNEKPMMSDMQMAFNLSGDEINASPMLEVDGVMSSDGLRSKERRSSKKRKMAQQARQAERKNKRQQQANFYVSSDTTEYK